MLTLQMNETMSGYLQLNGSDEQQPFSFTIAVALSRLPHRPQPFSGQFRLGHDPQTGRVKGELTFKITGPRYELDAELPGVGLVHIAGEKTYSLDDLKYSLTTCPLTVYRAGRPIGYAEVSYRDPLWEFPLKAFRVAFGA